MVLQQDNGTPPSPFDTGLPRVQTSDDVPRWLLVLGVAAALTLLVALLRYAADLLGVVFLIILVGFSIRAVSDWLTEGESVSGWALAAVVTGLFGTVVVGLLLFGSRELTTGVVERGVPGPIRAVVAWLDSNGWGQRVLLGGGGPPAASNPASAGVIPPAATPAEGKKTERAGGAGSEAEATAAKPGAEPHASVRSAVTSRTPAPVASASAAGAASADKTADKPVTPVATETALASSRLTSVVGTSVRFTATVTTESAGPVSGLVVFYDGGNAIGTASVHGASPKATATLSTLDLAIGAHQISAEFRGGRGFLDSRSADLTETVTRR